MGALDMVRRKYPCHCHGARASYSAQLLRACVHPARVESGVGMASGAELDAHRKQETLCVAQPFPPITVCRRDKEMDTSEPYARQCGRMTDRMDPSIVHPPAYWRRRRDGAWTPSGDSTPTKVGRVDTSSPRDSACVRARAPAETALYDCVPNRRSRRPCNPPARATNAAAGDGFDKWEIILLFRGDMNPRRASYGMPHEHATM